MSLSRGKAHGLVLDLGADSSGAARSPVKGSPATNSSTGRGVSALVVLVATSSTLASLSP